MDYSLKDKNILFVCSKFYTYHIEIKKSLENLGARVFLGLIEEIVYGISC